MTAISNKILLKWVLSGSLELREKAFAEMYRQYFPSIQNMILRNKGTSEDARDIFQDGLIALYKQIVNKKFNGDSTIKTYFYSICRNLWLKRLNRNKIALNVDEPGPEIPDSQDLIVDIETRERNSLIDQMVDHMGEGCKKVLRLYYFDQLPMKEIAKICGCASEQVAKNKKSRCMKKLRELVQSKGLFQHLKY